MRHPHDAGTLAGSGSVRSAGQSSGVPSTEPARCHAPQREALRTIGRDRAGPGIYLFEGICRKPQDRFVWAEPGTADGAEVYDIRRARIRIYELASVENLDPWALHCHDDDGQ